MLNAIAPPFPLNVVVCSYEWFRDPVDLNILPAPDYTTRVPKKDMRDIGTIKAKLGQGGYESPLDSIVADVAQLACNVHKYNKWESRFSGYSCYTTGEG